MRFALFAAGLFALAGCDALFDLDRLPAIEPDARGSGSSDPDAAIDTPSDAPDDAAKLDGGPDPLCASSYAGKRHQLRMLSFSWDMARSYCESLQVPNSTKYSHLVVIDDQPELDAVVALGAQAAWVGLINSNGWRYVTDQPSTIQPWYSGYPTTDAQSNCARIYVGPTGNWVINMACASMNGFVCECDDHPPAVTTTPASGK